MTDLSKLTPRLAAEGISNKGAARFLTKYNEVVGLDGKVSEKKVRGMRTSSKETLLEEVKGLVVRSLYFDGRNDKGIISLINLLLTIFFI